MFNFENGLNSLMSHIKYVEFATITQNTYKLILAKQLSSQQRFLNIIRIIEISFMFPIIFCKEEKGDGNIKPAGVLF